MSIIKNARMQSHPATNSLDAFSSLIGNIYGDRWGEIPDGEEITTSKVISINQDTNTVETEDETYQVEWLK